MKILVLSDLHLECGDFSPPAASADIAVVAGDLHRGIKGIAWLRSHFSAMPVIYVPGNHEYYHNAVGTLIGKLKAAAADSNIHVLDNESVTIEGVQFLGSTLWSDFKIAGTFPEFAGAESERSVNDFRLIRVASSYRRFRAKDAFILHHKAMQWLRTAVTTTSERTVVITHHAPSKASLPEKFKNDIVSAAYASDLEDFIRSSPIDLWVHGHVHASQDYAIGKTRVLCNPKGYPDEPNPEFNPSLVVQL